MKASFNKDFILILTGRIAQVFLTLLAIRILTTYLDKDHVGLTYLVTSITTYFGLILINPVGMYLNRKIHDWFAANELFSVFRILNYYFLGISLFSIPFVMLGYVYWGIGDQFSIWQIVSLIFLNLYVSTWFQTLCPGLNMLEQRNSFVRINLIAQGLGLLASVLGIFFVQKTAFIWLLGILLGHTVGALLSYLEFKKLGGRTNSVTSLNHQLQPLQLFDGKMLQFCLPIAATTTLMWLQNQSYRILVEGQMGPQALAVLGVGLSVSGGLAALVESLVNQYFYPKYYSVISSGNEADRSRAWNELFIKAISIYIPSCVFMACCGQFILQILVSQQFKESMQIVVWGAAIELARMLTNVLYIISQSEMKTRSTIIPYFLGAVLVVGGVGSILLSDIEDKIALIPPVLAFAGLAVVIAMGILMKRILPVQFNFKFIGLTCALCLPFTAALLIPYAPSLLLSFAVCGIFGSYLLFVFYLTVKKGLFLNL